MRGVAQLVCDDGGCTRAEHVPATEGVAVMPLREASAARACLPLNAHGACLPEGGAPPPPPPKKKKQPATPTPTPAAGRKTVPLNPPNPPTMPGGLRAPPPL